MRHASESEKPRPAQVAVLFGAGGGIGSALTAAVKASGHYD
ncbi:MAG: C-factor, partial [Methylocystaceae bacterium]|nr:C-factor [Methylocystaceae bacterium]